MEAQEIKKGNDLVPLAAVITHIVQETPDTRKYTIQRKDGKKPFEAAPGQLGMLSLPLYGEAMFAVTGQDETAIEMAIKSVGKLTNALFEVEAGQECGVRGPYGNGFAMADYRGRDILFIAGGIGLAPVRSAILHCLQNRQDYGKLTLIYGARSKDDLVFKEDLFANWPREKNMDIYLTLDKEEPGWEGHVGFVPAYVEELKPAPSVAIVCGPPVMIRFTMSSLTKMGFEADSVITTMEMRMKCGIGKCGRCNIGSSFVCLDGPVFTQKQLAALPPEW